MSFSRYKNIGIKDTYTLKNMNITILHMLLCQPLFSTEHSHTSFEGQTVDPKQPCVPNSLACSRH